MHAPRTSRYRKHLRDGGTFPASQRGMAQLAILLVLAALAAYVIGLLLRPFLAAIVTGAVLAALVHPALERLGRPRWPGLSAFLATVVVFFLILLPLLGLSFVLGGHVGSGIEWLTRVAPGILAPDGRLTALIEKGAGYFGADPQRIVEALSDEAGKIATIVAGRTISLLSGLGGWLVQGGAALFTLYYLLRDADRVVAAVRWLIPLPPPDADRLIRRAQEVTHATVFGNVGVAILQGAIGGIAFALLGISASALWGTLMAVLSLLPAVGAALVWAPAVVILIAGGEIVRGVVLLIVGTLVISTIDNVLRATLVSDRAQLHPLVVFFSVLGGIVVFGAAGVFIGPVLFVVGVTVIDMARTALDPDSASGLSPSTDSSGGSDVDSRARAPGDTRARHSRGHRGEPRVSARGR